MRKRKSGKTDKKIKKISNLIEHRSYIQHHFYNSLNFTHQIIQILSHLFEFFFKFNIFGIFTLALLNIQAQFFLQCCIIFTEFLFEHYKYIHDVGTLQFKFTDSI